MSTLSAAYESMSYMNLWFKTKSNDDLFMSDVPSLLPLRWNYFKTSWEFIRPTLLNQVTQYENPDLFSQQIIGFSAFIESQRNSASKINPFSDAVVLNKYYTIFDNIAIESIELTNEEQRLVDSTVNKVKDFSKNDFLKIKKTLRDYRDRYADSVSLTDPDYNRALSNSPVPAQTNATITDINYMLQLQEGIKTVDFVLANYFANDSAIDLFALARQNANNPDIDIGQYASGRLVKIEYGESLQSLANRYLGSPDKWLDIAIANGLKPPYIDEIGEKIPLISNGNGNLLNLSGTDFSGNLNIDKLYINQLINIRSDAEVAIDQRKIINIKQIPVSQEIIIEVDGASDLSKYQISSSAFMRVYKPSTINSGLYVLIPSADPLTDSRRDETPWFLASAASDEKQAQIDLAVLDSGDIDFTPNGDIKLSYGLNNAIQAIKFKISTPAGSLTRHPQYGVIDVFGAKNSDFSDIKAQLTDSILSQITADSRFERVENLNIEYNNSGASQVTVNLSVRLAGGGNKVIPISFTVNI